MVFMAPTNRIRGLLLIHTRKLSIHCDELANQLRVHIGLYSLISIIFHYGEICHLLDGLSIDLCTVMAVILKERDRSSLGEYLNSDMVVEGWNLL